MLNQNLTNNALSASCTPKTVQAALSANALWRSFASLCHYRIMAKRAGVVGCQEISSKK